MITRIKCQLASLTLAAIVLSSGAANAGIITVSDTTSWGNMGGSVTASTTGNSASQSSVDSQSIFLDGFDSNLGTLVGVDISFSSSWTLQNRFEVNDPTRGWFQEDNVNGSGGSRQTLTVDLITPNGGNPAQSRTLSNSCSDDDGFCSRNSAVGGSFSGSIPVFAALSEFIDIPNIQLNLTSMTNAFINNCADTEDQCRSIATNYWNGSATVNYRYDNSVAVAEPATLALLGLGMVFGGLSLRRSKP